MHILLEFLRQKNADIVNDHRAIKPYDAMFVEEGNIKFINPALEKGCSFLITSKGFGARINTQLEKYQLPIIDYERISDKIIDNLVSSALIIEINTGITVILEEFYTPKPKNCIAITGTNGKTSTANFTSSILHHLNKQNICIGTLGSKIGNRKLENHITLTTPSTYDLHKFLYRAKNNHNADYAVMEVSSHGLHQGRVDGINFNIGCFTNLTQDHLDYHKNMNDYFQSKASLFKKYVNSGGYAILNADIKEFSYLENICHERKINIIDYGYNAKILKLMRVEIINGVQKITILYKNNQYDFELNVIGNFQLMNVLCAMGAIIASGFKIETIIPIIPSLTPPPGRLQKCDINVDISCYIDYAHTPDALERAIKTIKDYHLEGRTILVFGCGGNRDKTKRSLMGKVAARNATIVIVTDDNPRTEDPADIRSDIISGIKELRSHQMEEMKKIDKISLLHLLQNEKVLGNLIEECGGRESAIAHAIEIAQPGDVILIAGKGHEDYQIIGEEKTYFSDIEIATKYLSDKK